MNNELTKEIMENKETVETIHETFIQDFKNWLHQGIVEFKYKKKNGDIREARGTLSLDVMGEENAPKGTSKEYSDDVIRYYDLNSEGWRSFIVDNLIEYQKAK